MIRLRPGSRNRPGTRAQPDEHPPTPGARGDIDDSYSAHPAGGLTSGSAQPPIHGAWRWLSSRGWFRLATVGTVIAGLVVVLGLLGWLFLGSPWLVANKVVVSGVSESDKQQVMAIVEKQLYQPLLKVDTAEVTEEIARAGAFASVSVGRHWPDTIAVSVRRRRAVVTLKDPQGALWLVDSSGARFASVRQPPTGVPEVRLASPDDTESLHAAITSVNAIPAAQKRNMTEVDATVRDRLVMRIGPTELIWGDSSRSTDKAKVLAALLQQGTASRIDVSTPDRPVTVG